MKKRIFLMSGVLILLAIFITAVLSFGMTYTWVDKNGVTRFTDYPPPANQVMQKKTKQSRVVKQQRRTSPKVELFITSWCHYCKKAKEYFSAKGVPFVAYDIEKNKKAAARKKKLDTRGGVPLAVVNGQIIHGYAPELYAKALKR